nr:V-type ATPase 116kDa subunit family protein [Thermanaerovibrio acidaminovorans]
MAVMRMLALTIVGPKEEMELVAREMVLSGGFQPMPLDYLISDGSIRAKVTTRRDNPYDELLTGLSSLWSAAGEEMPEPFPVTVDQSLSLDRLREEVERVASTVRVWRDRLEALEDRLEHLEASLILASALEEAGRSVEDVTGTRFLRVVMGSASDENFKRLLDSIEESPIIAREIRSQGGRTWAMVMTFPEYEGNMRKLLNSIYFKEYPPLPLGVDQLEEQISKIRRAMEALKGASRRRLSENRDYYERLFSRVYTMQRIYDLCQGRGEISGLFVLSGWIPEDTFQDVKDRVQALAPRSIFSVQDMPMRGDAHWAPTMLRNSRLVRAFQDVVALYSVPSYGEIDPSLAVAITFCLFFGFMFGDVGHGLMLMAGTWLMRRRGIMRRSFATVLYYAGASSIIFGFLYGSAFGVEGLLPSLWLSPMHDMDRLIGTAVTVGMLMVTTGMVFNMVTQYRRGDFGRLLFDGGGLAGLVFYWVAATVLYASFRGVALPVPSWVISLGLTGLVAVMVLRDVLARVLLKSKTSHQEPLYLQAFEALHGIMSFLSNTASFVRLAAFALNHVGLSLAVMMLSDMVKDLPGGLFFRGLILVAGNLLIVGLEGLIVFIQTLRLEYYEFFSKFYRGGGRTFKPIGWDNPRVRIGGGL